MKVGIAQLVCAERPEENRESTVAAATELFRAGADVVVVPELGATGYRLDPEYLDEAAEPLHGPTTDAWQAIAAEHGGVVVGGFCERHGEHRFNTAVLVDARGVRLHYRKLHLFGREKRIFSPGDLGLPVVETALGTLGVCVCYDLRFVEVLRVLALQGAELVCCPSAWVAGFDVPPPTADGASERVPGQVLGVTVQSNLNQVFVAAASLAGPSPSGGKTPPFLGHSLVADPTGAVLLGPFGADQRTCEVATFDLAAVEAAKRRSTLVTPRDDRRTDVYGISYEGRTL